MPDRTKLQVGETIRLLAVPRGDLEQREREIRDGLQDAGWTADTIGRIIAHSPVVTIARIEHGMPWFDVELTDARGDTEFHALAIMDDDSWERVAS